MTKMNTHQQRGKTTYQRFIEKTHIRDDGCWEWLSARQGGGYGVFWVGGGKTENAHRYSWEVANGQKIPAGMVVMHSCNNKWCVNPNHLSVGTPQQNAISAVRDGIASVGVLNGSAKLTPEQVVEIFTCTDMGCCRLSKKYGVHMTTIKAIRRMKTWDHLTAPIAHARANHAIS